MTATTTAVTSCPFMSASAPAPWLPHPSIMIGKWGTGVEPGPARSYRAGEAGPAGWDLSADRAVRGGTHELGVLRQHTPAVPVRNGLPAVEPGLDLVGLDQQIQGAVGDVQPDPVPVADRGDRAA